jgi:hypothetical protein
LQFVDPYGDTIFNGLQMKPFLAEWESLSAFADAAERDVLERVKGMAKFVESSPHHYLKFVGD